MEKKKRRPRLYWQVPGGVKHEILSHAKVTVESPVDRLEAWIDGLSNTVCYCYDNITEIQIDLDDVEILEG